MKVLKFYAEWCQPCKMLSRVIDDAKDKLAVQIEEVDIDTQGDVARQYNVRGVPTMILVDDKGAVVRSQVGYVNENQLVEFVNG